MKKRRLARDASKQNNGRTPAVVRKPPHRSPQSGGKATAAELSARILRWSDEKLTTAALVDRAQALLVATYPRQQVSMLVVLPERRTAVVSEGVVVPVRLRGDEMIGALRQKVGDDRRVVVGEVMAQAVVVQDEVVAALCVRHRQNRGRAAVAAVLHALAAALSPLWRSALLEQRLLLQSSGRDAKVSDLERTLSEMRAQLAATSRHAEHALAVFSHDVRGPLQVLLGHAHLLSMASTVGQAERESIGAVERMGRKILSLAEDTLEKTRHASGQPSQAANIFDVAQVCVDLANDFAAVALAQGVRLRAEAPVSLAMLGDELQIRQVLQNLVTNALKHGGEAKQVTVRARRVVYPGRPSVRIDVDDDGAGFPSDLIPVLFDRLRGPKGLGLKIARELVEAHQGQIWGERRVEGGARVSLVFPLAEDSELAVSAPSRTLGGQHDELTALLGRAGLTEVLARELTRSPPRPVVLMMRPAQKLLDANVLRRCAAMVRSALTQPEVAGHLGEGVFAIVVPHAPGEYVQHLVEWLAKVLRQTTGAPWHFALLDLNERSLSPEGALETLYSSTAAPARPARPQPAGNSSNGFE